MKNKLLLAIVAVTLFFLPQITLATAPVLGTTSNFVLFTSIGAVTNTANSQLTGNVGSNSGSSTGFGNVNGAMLNGNGETGACEDDLLLLYNELNTATPTSTTHAALLGNGETLNSGIYAISEVTTLSNTLTLDGQNNANAMFIFQIGGTFSSTVSAKVVLINGAQACNVFWKVEGLISLATATSIKGTMIANNGAIDISAGVTIEGRALSTNGAISINSLFAYTPSGCGNTVLTGPAAPVLLSTTCYSVFSALGNVTNSGTSTIRGDVGSNVGLTNGFDALKVDGAIHPIADGSTSACAADLLTVYDYLKLLPSDIELLYPPQLGNNLVLTPHTYLLNGATFLTDSLYLNAQGNANAVFVIQIQGAFETSTKAKVLLTNGTQAKNVFWLVEGAVDLNDSTEFVGSIICNNGALNLRNGVKLEGKALTTNGAVLTADVTVNSTTNCVVTDIVSLNTTKIAAFHPNPMSTSLVITLNDASVLNSTQLSIYNVLGKMMVNKTLTQNKTTIATNFPSGIYFYKVMDKNKNVQSGKLISK